MMFIINMYIAYMWIHVHYQHVHVFLATFFFVIWIQFVKKNLQAESLIRPCIVENLPKYFYM